MVIQSRNVTFIETPTRTIPSQQWDDQIGYERDVVKFVSLLDNSLSTNDADRSLDCPIQAKRYCKRCET